MADAQNVTSRLERIYNLLKQIHLDAWRLDGQDLVNWMKKEAEDMAKAERDVAISKVTGGSAAIVGGVLTSAGIVASCFTFGLATPLVVAGVVLGGAGGATSAGGDIAKLSILHMKTCEIKRRCESFEQRTEGMLSTLREMLRLMGELSTLCQKDGSIGILEIIQRSGKSATVLANSGIDVCRVATIIYDITQLQKSGAIFGADFLKLVGSGLNVSRVAFQGAGAAVGIGFGIWDVVDASGTLQNGGSHASLIRHNASQINNTIIEIDKALCQLRL